jgi:hypothetical protein
MSHPTKLLVVTALTVLFTACSVTFSSKEYTQGINDVTTYFGGNCSYSKNVDYESGSGKTETIKIEINNSNVASELSDKPGISASHAAYIFYNALNKDKKTVDIIQVTINYSDGSSTTNQYSSSTLDSAKRFMPIVNGVVNALRMKNYDSVGNMFNTAINPDDKMHVLNVIERSDSMSGAVKKFQLQGFKIIHEDYGNELGYFGVIQREKHDYQFVLGVIPGDKNGIIYNISYHY